jgi:hypothetical protein
MYLCLQIALYFGFRELNFFPSFSSAFYTPEPTHTSAPAGRLFYVDTRTSGIRICAFFVSSLCRRHFLQELIIAHPVKQFPAHCRLAVLHHKCLQVVRIISGSCIETPMAILSWSLCSQDVVFRKVICTSLAVVMLISSRQTFPVLSPSTAVK